MFLKEEKFWEKSCGCPDRCKQKAETSSSTVTIESLILSCLINAMERPDVATCDIPAAFMQADIDEEIHIKFKGKLVDLLISIDLSYSECVLYAREYICTSE
jgi:hypothetical protein